MALTYETLANGKIKEINTYTRIDGVDVVEKKVFKLAEMEATIANQIANLESQLESIQAQVDELKIKRDEFALLRGK